MTGSKTISTISHQTPMTLALALFIGSGLYYAGVVTADYRHAVENVTTQHDQFRDDTLAWRAEITRLLNEMSQVARDNKRRLDLIEADLLEKR